VDDIKVSEMLMQNLGNIRSYILLYAKYANVCAYVIALVSYLWSYVQLFWVLGLRIIH